MKRLLSVLVLLLVSTSLFAQVQYRTEAKFVCGRPGTPEIDAFAFASGLYYTSINVTNPNDFGTAPVQGRKRFSVGLLSQKVGPMTNWVAWSLAPGQTMQVDCGDIYAQLGIPVGTFIDGFVHFVGGANRYSVTGVYTVSDGTRIVSQDVEAKEIR